MGTALLVLHPAQAATETKNLTVSVRITNLCDLTLGSSTISFGSIEPGQQADAQANINVRCTDNVVNPPTVTVGNGMFFGEKSGFSTSRAMWSGLILGVSDHYVAYNFFSDAGRTVLIGSNGLLPLSIPGGTGWNGSVDAVIYARIPAGQSAVSSGFTDTVAITLTYEPL